MKKIITLFILSIVAVTSVKSQVVGIYIKYYDLKSATKSFNGDFKKKSVTNGTLQLLNDTLYIHAENNKENISIKLNFIKYEYFDQCEYQYMTFKCSECATKHLNEFLKDKGYGFKKIAENKYVSKYSQQTELEVKQDATNENCLTLVLRYINKPKKEYKEWYSSL